MSLLNAVAETTQPTIFSHFMNLYNEEICLFCRQLADLVLQTLVPPIIVGKFICLLAFFAFFPQRCYYLQWIEAAAPLGLSAESPCGFL